MSWSRAALASWGLLALAGPAGREEIVFRVAADTTLVRTVKSDYSMHLESMTLSMDGEEVPPDARCRTHRTPAPWALSSV